MLPDHESLQLYMSTSGPCTLTEGTAEPPGAKHVVFGLHGTTADGAMSCKNDYSAYFSKAMGGKVLAAFTF